MRVISSTVLRNNYSEISEQCHMDSEPMIVTRNGNGDLAIMGIDSYEQLRARLDFYEFLMQGRRDAEEGRVVSARDASLQLRQELGL